VAFTKNGVWFWSLPTYCIFVVIIQNHNQRGVLGLFGEGKYHHFFIFYHTTSERQIYTQKDTLW